MNKELVAENLKELELILQEVIEDIKDEFHDSLYEEVFEDFKEDFMISNQEVAYEYTLNYYRENIGEFLDMFPDLEESAEEDM